MPDPTDPNATAAPTEAHASAASSADETSAGHPAPRPAAAPGFGPPAAAGEVGTLGPYRVLKELGRGGMGAVFAALDTRLDRRVALKVMLPEFAADAAAKERFLREAKAAARVKHAHVVTVFEADERDGVPYIAMEFLEGLPLDAYLKKKGSPSLPQTVRIATEAAAGLAAAHRLGLVHRDVKPANLWLEAPGGAVKVLDFGLARPVGAESELTKTGAVVGTPAYMSPEQARGLKVDARTDLFSLGAVLYRLVTGRNPFAGEHVMAVLAAVLTDEPTPVRDLNPAVPEPLAALIHQLLSKRPEDRPPSADEVAERLRAILARMLSPAADVSASRPAVVRPAPGVASMHVTAAPEGAFAHLTDDEGDEDATEVESPPAPPKKGGKGLLIAAGVTVLLVVGVVAVVASQMGKKEPPVAEKPPEPVLVPTPKPGPNLPNPPKPPADPDRAAAEWVLSIGGSVKINGENRELKSTADLSKEPFALTSVDLLGNKTVTDAGLVHLTDCKSLTNLGLKDTSVSDVGLAHLKGCKGLTSLTLSGTSVSDEGMAHLKELKSLTGLFMYGTKVSGAGLSHLKELKSLQDISLSGAQVTDAGAAHLKELKSLTKLWLLDSPVTDAGLAHLKELTNLTTLWVRGAKVTDAGLAHLKGCKRLTSLTLDGSPVTDAVLIHLQEFNALTHLNVRNTKVTAKGVAQFHTTAPGCRIEHDGGVIKPTSAFPPLDPEWAEKVRALKPDDQVKEVAEELKRRNPGFDGKLKSWQKPVVGAEINSDVADITPLRAYPKLEEVYINMRAGPATIKLANLEPLAGLPLRTVFIQNCPLVTDLTPLRGMPLTYLHLVHTGVTSLEPVRGASLKKLHLIGTPVTDLGPIAGMRLEEFFAHEPGRDLDYGMLKGMPVRYLGVSPSACSPDEWAVLRTLPVEHLNIGSSYKARDEDKLWAFLKAVPTVTNFSSNVLTYHTNPTGCQSMATVVRAFPNIKTINDKPAAEFWKAFDAKK